MQKGSDNNSKKNATTNILIIATIKYILLLFSSYFFPAKVMFKKTPSNSCDPTEKVNYTSNSLNFNGAKNVHGVINGCTE